ncbi:ectomycorrhiza-induced ankyrin-domain nacht-domain containing protein [Niveomyces insectorum RCEF 264]|uniref:Ectomycorrhiza-induced ankyrin-domain nacht-domain containing protein n=1 Tax=Niveomyces insectorum RCEF 264 TaxID=1081102 RepID=A0A167RVZ4_9HYPO|nr:ectomycorrhiza-induced ankyrin-domain nacht-domain containing protein [Niveomyces insectorum RCEF 264]
MNRLSTELLYAISELLSRHSLAQLCRADRRCCVDLQPLLFRLHGHPDDWNGPSAVFWAVEMADAKDAASQTLALAVLGKVDRFCRLGPGDLDRSFNRRLGGRDDVWRARRAFTITLLYADRAKDWLQAVGKHPSFNPLHLAAHKGLDVVVAWLLQHGANVNALIEGTPHNALIPAVVANHASTALLLLAHGAHQAVDMTYGGFSFGTAADAAAAHTNDTSGGYKPLVTTLAAAMGHEALAEKLMDSGFVPATSPSEMLYVYAQYNHSRPEFAASLVRRGAEASPRMLQYMAKVAGRLWAALPLSLLEAMPLDGPVFAQTWTPALADKTVLDITTTFQRDLYFSDFHDNHYDHDYFDVDVEKALRALRRLLMIRGVDVDAGGRSLWRQSSFQPFDYALVKHLLPPFLEAGMDVRCRCEAPRPPTEHAQQEQPPHYGLGNKREVPDDLLAATSRYEPTQCVKGAAMQLGVVRLLLQHGAPITAATRDNALRDHPVGPSVYTTIGRSGWCTQLCAALLEHCCHVPTEKPREDVRTFLALYREKTKRVSLVNAASARDTKINNIKPNNILLDYEETTADDLVVKRVQISDLEDAVLLSPGKHLKGCLCGNQLWRSPESWARARQNTPSDVFSFGVVVIYVMLNDMIFLVSNEELAGKEAWRPILRRHISYFGDEDGFKGLLQHVGEDNVFFERLIALAGDFDAERPRRPFARWYFVDAELRDLVVKVTNLDPARRITAREALQHAWFRQNRAS